MGGKAIAKDGSILKTAEPALSWSVIPAVALITHQVDHTVVLQLSLITMITVLGAC